MPAQPFINRLRGGKQDNNNVKQTLLNHLRDGVRSLPDFFPTMHIVLVSACERRALKRSRAVLDSYALRTGERSWATPITLEGMNELRTLLKRSATRQTAVACYRNDGRERMRLLWVVGSRSKFGEDGHFPAGTMRRAARPVPLCVRAISLLARAGGLSHDWGKAGIIFQTKLAACDQAARAGKFAPFTVDAIRHELLSLRLLESQLRTQSLDAAELRFTHVSPLLDAGVHDGASALAYLVGTHHKLFAPEKELSRNIGPERHVRDHVAGTRLFDEQAFQYLEPVRQRFAHVWQRLATLTGECPSDFWRGAAPLARAALILADHIVSARSHAGPVDKPGPQFYANTGPDRRFKQPLDEHLLAVADKAAELAWRMLDMRLDGLSPASVATLLTPTDAATYAWQNRAVACLESLRNRSEAPVLVFNMAATGAGKTLANAKCACVLRPQRPRFAIALNLRSLTLQTGHALQRALQLGDDELSTIIGDRIASRMFVQDQVGTFAPPDDEADATLTDYDAHGEAAMLPAWLDPVVARQPVLRPILGAPVLVSTLDYLIAAGEPGRQGHHVSALLRLVDSDLVLDEIDAYEPAALVAVLRVVRMAALLGRNVICASATLPVPVADAVARAFADGQRIHAALHRTAPLHHVVILDDQTPPTTLDVHATDDAQERFVHALRTHTATLLELPRPYLRAAFVQDVSPGTPAAPLEGFHAAIADAVERLHAEHGWTTASGARVSFGLVRIANIQTAIEVARELARRFPHARVACYHARDFRIQRHLKERRLDTLLNRHRGNQAIEQDAEIRALLAANPHSRTTGVPFIVVATPVEEIGRDHDFDWGVIEPSSAHSIVQIAGRINRHRRTPIATPNIAILRHNARHLREGAGAAVFRHPGLELADPACRYASHDLRELLRDAVLEPLDAHLRLGQTFIASEEDRLLHRHLAHGLDVLLRTEAPGANQWMCEAFYRAYGLRTREAQEHWHYDPELGYHTWRHDSWQTDAIKETPRCDNDWLAWNLDELIDACHEYGIAPQDGLAFQVRANPRNPAVRPRRDTSFGFMNPAH